MIGDNGRGRFQHPWLWLTVAEFFREGLLLDERTRRIVGLQPIDSIRPA